jgi:MFS family permease
VDNRRRLFVASCCALVANAIAASIGADIMGDFEREFRLVKSQLGLAVSLGAVVGVTLMFVGSAILDVIGMGRALWIAFACHVLGVTSIIFAQGFWSLALSSLFLGAASSMVETSINPLAATMYPGNKTHVLNVLHAWWPGGLIIGGLLAVAMTHFLGLDPETSSAAALSAGWKIKIALVFIPVALYAVLIFGQTFPKSERVQAGVPTRVMFRQALRPFFLMLVFCMLLTATTELGPLRWVGPFIRDIAHIQGVLFIVYTSGLMFVLRFFAGPLARWLSPIGLMIVSSVVSAIGLFVLGSSSGAWSVFVAATIFGLGVTYFWPTMLGIASERFPKGGALALGILGGAAGLFLAYVVSPGMGALHGHYTELSLRQNLPADLQKHILDSYTTVYVVRDKIGERLEAEINRISDRLEAERKRAAAAVTPPKDEEKPVRKSLLTRIADVLPQLSPDQQAAVRAAFAAAQDPDERARPHAKGKITLAMGAPEVLDQLAKDGQRITSEALEVANRTGACTTFRWIGVLPIILVVLFGAMFLHDRRRGGYKQEILTPPGS